MAALAAVSRASVVPTPVGVNQTDEDLMLFDENVVPTPVGVNR